MAASRSPSSKSSIQSAFALVRYEWSETGVDVKAELRMAQKCISVFSAPKLVCGVIDAERQSRRSTCERQARRGGYPHSSRYAALPCNGSSRLCLAGARRGRPAIQRYRAARSRLMQSAFRKYFRKAKHEEIVGKRTKVFRKRAFCKMIGRRKYPGQKPVGGRPTLPELFPEARMRGNLGKTKLHKFELLNNQIGLLMINSSSF